jgi:methylated-DNA-[protein]-cysteine S-methyltransferase
MNQIKVQFCTTKIGELILGSFEEQLCLLDFRYRKKRNTVDSRIKRGLHAEFVESDSETIQQTLKQLREYLNGERKVFKLPLLWVGTAFQKAVWRSLMNIPYGATATYLQVATEIGNEKAVRAVANANGANAIGLIIPCHRIIGSDGQLVGYGGGLRIKKHLLDLERQ